MFVYNMISSWFYLEITYQILSFKQKISFLIYTFTVILCKHITCMVYSRFYIHVKVYIYCNFCALSVHICIYLLVQQRVRKEGNRGQWAIWTCSRWRRSRNRRAGSHSRYVWGHMRVLRPCCPAMADSWAAADGPSGSAVLL